MALALLNTSNTQIVALVNAIFNVAPGYTYLSNFSGYASQFGVAKTADALTALAGQTDAAFTASLVSNLGLTGAAATAGTAYITGRLNAKASQGTVALEAVTFFATAAAKADATYGAAATAFAATVERSEIYSTNSANTSTDVTVLSQVAQGKVPQTFTLTAGDNTFTGGNGDDTFSAASGTYDVARDKLDGGAGNDTLSVTMTAADITPAAKNIEKLQFLMTDGTAGTADTSTVTLDSTKVTGVTSVEFYNYNGSTAGTEDTAEVAGVTTETVRLVSGSNYNATVTLKDATGTTDAATVDLEDAAAKLLTVDGVETVTINSVGTATAGNVLSSGLDADAMTKLVVTGAAKVNLGAVEDTGKAVTIDASANTGGVTATFAQNPLADTKAFKLTGSSGNDNFTFDPTDIDGDTGTTTRYYSVDFGAGTDTLTFVSAVTGLTAADLKKGLASFTNYETVSFKGDEHAGVNLLTTGLQGKTLSVNNAAGATFSNALSGVVVNVDTAVTSNAVQVSFAGAGSKDATLNLKGKAAILEAGSGTGSFSGVQNLVITNTATTSTDVALADIDDFNGAKLTLSGNGGIDLSSDKLSTSTVEVAASAMTDSLSVKTSSSGTLINSGSGVDTIVINGFAVQDEVHSGAGNDTITLKEDDGANTATNAVVLTDIIDGGEGTDTLQIAGDQDMNVTTDITGMTITNVEKLEVAKANTAKTHVLTMTSAQSAQFAGTKTAAADLDATTDAVVPTVTVKMAAADTAVSGTSLVDTFKAAASQVGFTVTGGAANDVLDLAALTSADWGNMNGNAAEVNASTEWYFDNATDTLTVWDDVASHAVAIKLTGVATVTATNKTFAIATLDA